MSRPPELAGLAGELIEAIAQRAADLAAERVLSELGDRADARERPLVSLGEAAVIARVSPSTIKRRLREGRLHRYGTARRALVSRAELLALLAGSDTNGDPPRPAGDVIALQDRDRGRPKNRSELPRGPGAA
jgi:hypothetical protein